MILENDPTGNDGRAEEAACQATKKLITNPVFENFRQPGPAFYTILLPATLGGCPDVRSPIPKPK
jgi:hypothetical protein